MSATHSIVLMVSVRMDSASHVPDMVHVGVTLSVHVIPDTLGSHVIVPRV